MNLFDTICRMISPEKPGHTIVEGQHTASSSTASSQTHFEEPVDHPEASAPKASIPYLEWGSQGVLIKEHLLIGRYKGHRKAQTPKQPVAGEGSISDEGAVVRAVKECYNPQNPSGVRPRVRFLANHQLVLPRSIPPNELISYSRHHALVLYTPQLSHPLHIIDPQSTAGIWVNSEKIPVYPGSAETLKDDPQSLEQVLTHAKPLNHYDLIQLCDPSFMPQFYLRVIMNRDPHIPAEVPTVIGDKKYSFLE